MGLFSNIDGLGNPADYGSLGGYGLNQALAPPVPVADYVTKTPWTSPPIDPLTGQQDFLAGIGAPAQASGQVDLSGLNFGNASSGSSLSDLFGGNTFGGFLGKTENGVATQGWGGLALGAAQSIGNIFMGMKQYGLAKDQLTQSKKQFDLNFGAQQKLTNANLEDRQRARVASNPGAYQSVGDYMKAHGI